MSFMLKWLRCKCERSVHIVLSSKEPVYVVSNMCCVILMKLLFAVYIIPHIVLKSASVFIHDLKEVLINCCTK